MEPMIHIDNVKKTYHGGFAALSGIDLKIQKGEIFALLGPNGAGKTTLISIICGITNMTSGQVLVGGHDIIKDYRKARDLIGLVPQELTTDAFETVLATVHFTRGLFGKKRDDAFVDDLLKKLSLYDKRKNRLMTLSGGMKRRLLIAKALSHKPKVLFLDEPTAGVDVELRKDMWEHVRQLKEQGVTIILTTHYIEEAEEIADRIGVINGGKIIEVEEKNKLMEKLGRKEVVIELEKPLMDAQKILAPFSLKVTAHKFLTYEYDPKKSTNRVQDLLAHLEKMGIRYRDLSTKQSSLEDIFVKLVQKP